MIARAAAGLSIAMLCGPVSACAATSPSAAAPSVAPTAPVSSPPTPAATDWKGLFDSDSQSSNVPPDPASVAQLLAREPGCTRALGFASGGLTAGTGFTVGGFDETAYLLECGATQRVVVANQKATLASLDVPEDTLEAAGDMDAHGAQELLLIGHAGSQLTLRALRVDGKQLTPVYAFNMTLEPCTHTIIYYRLLSSGLDFRQDKLPKRCAQ